MIGLAGRGIHSVRLWSTTLGWWMFESTRMLAWRGILGVILALLGPVLQVGVLLMVLGYAAWLASNESRTYFGLEWIPRDSPRLLVAIAAISAVTLLIAAFLRWAGAILMLKCRLRIERVVGERIADRATTEFMLPGQSGEAGMLRVGDVLKLARRDGRAAGRVVVSLHMAVPAVVFSVASLATLVWISPLLTLALVPVLGFSSWLLARIGRRAAAASLQLEEATPRSTSAIKEWLRRPRASSVYGDDVVETAAHAYMRRLRGTPDSHFVSDLSLAVLVAGILVALGPGGPGGEQGWERLVGYLVGLRIFQGSLRQLGGRLAGVNRFYPQLRRLRKALLPMAAPDPATQPESWPVVARDGSGRRVELVRGSRLAVVVPSTWSPMVVGTVARGLASGPGRTRRMLRSVTAAGEDLEDAVARARSTGRWIVLVPAVFLDPEAGEAALPEASDLAFVVVHRRTASDLPRFGEEAVVAIDLVEEHGPLLVVSSGRDIDDAALSSGVERSEGGNPVDASEVEEEDDDDF